MYNTKRQLMYHFSLNLLRQDKAQLQHFQRDQQPHMSKYIHKIYLQDFTETQVRMIGNQSMNFPQLITIKY